MPWEIIRLGDTVDTPAGKRQDATVAVSFTCPIEPAGEDGQPVEHTFEQEVLLPVKDAARTAEMDRYAADYQAGYCGQFETETA